MPPETIPPETKVDTTPNDVATKTQDETQANNNPLIPSGTTPSAITTAPPEAPAPAIDYSLHVGETPEQYTARVAGARKEAGIDQTPETKVPATPETGIMAKPVAPTTPAPVVPDQSAKFAKLYTDYGVAGMQTQLTDLNTQKSAVADELSKFKLAQTGEGTEAYTTARISEDERNAMARSDFLTRQMSALNDRITTANTYIKEVMDLTNTDYTNASKQWNDNFSHYLSAQTEYNTEATKEQNEAAAYISSVQKMIADNNVPWDSISPALRATVQLEETKAGYPPGTLEAFAKLNPKAGIISTGQINDGSGSTYITSKDPVTGVFKTTISTPSTTSTTTVPPSPATGYGAEILKDTNTNTDQSKHVDPNATISDVLKSDSQTTALFDAMAKQEGGDSAAGAKFNNPLDLKYIAGNTYGATNSEQEALDGGTWAKFDNKEDAYNAYKQILLKDPHYPPGTTVDQALKTWSNYKPSTTATSTLWNVNDASLPPKGDAANEMAVGISPVTGAKVPTGRTINNIFQSAVTLSLDKSATAQKFLGGLSGSSGQGQAIKNAISNKSSALIAAAGVDQATLQQEFSANSGAINKQVDYMNSVQRALTGAEKGAQVTQELFKNKSINPNDSTWINTTVNGITKQLGDSGDIRAYQAAMVEVGNEYAQVFARGGQRNEAGNALAQELINGNVKLSDIQTTLDTLQAIGKTVISTSVDQVKSISSGGGTDSVAKFLAYVNGVSENSSSTQYVDGKNYKDKNGNMMTYSAKDNKFYPLK